MINWLTSRIRRFWRWIARRPKKVTIPVGVVVLAIIATGAYYLVHFYSYMEHDPSFCQSCHVMETPWDKWATSEHKDIGCHDCHQQSLVASSAQLFNFIFGDFERVEKHAEIPDEVCKNCHENGDSSRWKQVAATAGHQVHAEEQNIACVKCHSVSVHRFTPPGAICSICHEEKKVELAEMADMHCTNCHEFLVQSDQLLPSRASCLKCHEALAMGEITWPEGAPMSYPCGDCHKPHEVGSTVIDCSTCHQVGGMHLAASHAAGPCTNCHQPHAWTITERDTCLRCHPDKAEHNSGIFCGRCHNFET